MELTDYERLREDPAYFISEILGVEPFSYQEEFLNTDCRNRALVSGRQVGKSRMCAWAALHHAVTTPHSMTLITAPSQRQSSNLFKQLRSEMSQSGLSDELWGVDRDTQTIIEFDNGAEIHCLPTGREGNNIRGYSADMVIVDEAAFVADKIFEDVLKPMTFATTGDMLLASTPFGTSGYFYKKATEWHADEEYWSSWDPENGGISSATNPLVSEEDIEEFKEGKTERQIKQEVRGEFVEDGSQFFGASLVRDAMEGGKPSYDPEKKTYLGVDIAGSGSAETVFVSVHEDGTVFDIESHGEMGVLDAGDRIVQLDRMYDYGEVVVDETGIGRGTAEKLGRERNMSNKFTAMFLSIQTKQQAYQGLKAALEHEQLYLPMDTTLKTQLEAIGYSESKTGNLSFAPDQGNDDYVDALALAVWAMPETVSGESRGARGSTTAITFGGNTRDSGRQGRTARNARSRNRQRQHSRSVTNSSSSRRGRRR